VEDRLLVQKGEVISVTASGWSRLEGIGIAETGLPASRRPLCKTCLDWSMRRHHLAGQIGHQMLVRIFELKWARRVPDARIIAFTPAGEKHFRAWLQVPV
jgi:hypothetical protein